MKKLLAIGIILLFFGVACSPSIYADTTPEEEYVEFTTEVCGLRGYEPKTVRLTQSQADEVDRIFENLRMQLNGTVSLEETVDIYTDAVDELARFGLLGDISVNVMKRLIQRQYILNKLLQDKLIFNGESLEEEVYENRFCFITGKISDSYFSGYLKGFSRKLIEDYLYFIPLIGVILYYYIFIPSLFTCIFHNIRIIHLLDFVYFGIYDTFVEDWYPSKGWLSTISNTETWNVSGSIYGNFDVYLDLLVEIYKLGVVNFCGIKILDRNNIFNHNNYILGIASHVKIKTVDDT